MGHSEGAAGSDRACKQRDITAFATYGLLYYPARLVRVARGSPALPARLLAAAEKLKRHLVPRHHRAPGDRLLAARRRGQPLAPLVAQGFACWQHAIVSRAQKHKASSCFHTCVGAAYLHPCMTPQGCLTHAPVRTFQQSPGPLRAILLARRHCERLACPLRWGFAALRRGGPYRRLPPSRRWRRRTGRPHVVPSRAGLRLPPPRPPTLAQTQESRQNACLQRRETAICSVGFGTKTLVMCRGRRAGPSSLGHHAGKCRA